MAGGEKAGKRGMGFWTCSALVIGNMVGSGVFLLPSSLAAFGGLSLFGWLVSSTGAVLLALGYACAALAFWMLYNLYRFLQRLEQGQVFVPQTVQALRRISGCCAGAALLCLPVGVFLYLPFVFLAVAAGFMALLVRVLQNAFAQAVRMKDELDYTV